MKMSTSLRAAIALALGLAVTPAFAEDAALKAEIEALRAQMQAQARLLAEQQAKLEELTKKLQAPADAPAQSAPAQVAAAPDVPKLAFNNGRPTFTSADGKSSMSVRAIAQMDGAIYGESAEGPLAADFRRGSVGGGRENNAARDFSDGFSFRRARFGVDGVFNSNWNYRLLFEFAGSGTEGPARINDAWISYTGFAPFAFQVGAFSPPSNMDDSTTPDDQVFVERASAAELSRALGGADGRLGFGVRSGGKRWMSALNLTTRTVNDAEMFDSQLAAVGRVGGLVATSDDFNVHLGANATYVFSPADQGSSASPPRHPLRFRDRPEVRVDGLRLIDTGSIDAAHASAYGVEVGANWRSFYVQAENFWFDVDRRDATLDDPSFGGYYLQGSWLITGETRRYNAATGSFQNPRPKAPFAHDGGWGAFELAARFSHADLNFNEGDAGLAPVASAIRGGEQDVLALGINWYVNANIKFLLDYLMIDVNRLNPAGPGNTAPFGAGVATPPIGAEIGQDLDAFVLRTQFSF
ncbi:MAG TPA: porin [Steroidobacteraceae bacterium]|nr:porin [Steroidobacteraceae bacterium]